LFLLSGVLSAVDVRHSYCFMATISKAHNNSYTDMRRLTTGMLSEKRVIRRFRLSANLYWHKPR